MKAVQALSSNIPRGVFCAAATPLNADLQIDMPAYVDHCAALVESGCTGLAMLGSTGEANSFSAGERMALVEGLLKSGLSPDLLMPGTGVAALPDTVELTRHALQCGVRTVVMLPPFYYKDVSEQGVIDAYSYVFEQVADPALRVVLYHIPQMSCVPITHGVIAELMKRFPGTVVGVKDSAGNLDHMQQLAAAFPELSILAGVDPLMLPLLKSGGGGCTTATSNLCARELAVVFAHHADPARQDEVAAAQQRIVAMRNAISIHPQLASLKAVLAQRTGRASWALVRPPLRALDALQAAEVIKAAGVAA